MHAVPLGHKVTREGLLQGGKFQCFNHGRNIRRTRSKCATTRQHEGEVGPSVWRGGGVRLIDPRRFFKSLTKLHSVATAPISVTRLAPTLFNFIQPSLSVDHVTYAVLVSFFCLRSPRCFRHASVGQRSSAQTGWDMIRP